MTSGMSRGRSWAVGSGDGEVGVLKALVLLGLVVGGGDADVFVVVLEEFRRVEQRERAVLGFFSSR